MVPSRCRPTMANPRVREWIAPSAGADGVDRQVGRIGPNAVTRLAEALLAVDGGAQAKAVFDAAGLARHLDQPPSAMVDETDVALLHRMLHRRLGAEAAARVSADAGRRTGDYLLAHRIPPAAQVILQRLPRRFAAALLVRAIARHAWTFAGSGRFSYRRVPTGLELTLAGGPIARLVEADGPVCHFYAATFERVFGAMLGPGTRVVETDCEAAGADACRFLVRW